jgi:ribokinase
MRRDACSIVVLGGINTDYLVRTRRLPQPDAPIADGQFVQSCGGKGLNQAVAIARLGGRASLVGCAGHDRRGDEAIAQLSVEGVGAEFVRRHRGAPTGAAVIQVDRKGRKQTSAALGANEFLAIEQVDAAADLIAAARMLLVQLEVPIGCVARAVEIAREHAVEVIFDPAPARELPDAVIHGVHVLKPNAGEARALTGIEVHDRTSASHAARQLHARGARNVIVALETGTLLFAYGTDRWFPNLPVETVDTTGAGDAFAGALAVALSEERDLHDAIAFAQAGAALATTQIGALPSLPRRAALQRLLESSHASFQMESENGKVQRMR